MKQYFEKIKTAESAGMGPRTKLDRAAASRFIKHALVSNDTVLSGAHVLSMLRLEM